MVDARVAEGNEKEGTLIAEHSRIRLNCMRVDHLLTVGVN